MSTAIISPIVANNFPTISIQDGDLANISMTAVTSGIGQLTATAVSGLIASRALMVAQLPTDITTSRGLGKFGLNIQHLVNDGFISQAVLEKLLSSGSQPASTPDGLGIVAYQSLIDPDLALAAINSPSSWQGKLGIMNVNQLLANEKLQQQIYFDAIVYSYNQLLQDQTITAYETGQTLAFVVGTAAGLSIASTEAFLKGSS